MGRIGLDHGHLEAGEAQRFGMDPGEAQLEHVAGRRAEELEQPRRRGRRQCRRQAHVQTLTFAHRGAARSG